MGAKAKVRLEQAVSGKVRPESDPWWDGRQVAIRPDVPGPGFDPMDLVIIRTDEERLKAQSRIDQSVTEIKAKSSKELWPDWLWEGGDEASEDSARSSDPNQD